MPIGFSQIILIFIVYSVLGWAAETLMASLYARRFVYRGFLSGPFCPTYGIGALVFMWVGGLSQGNPLLVFLLAAAIATILELLTGGVLQLLFHIRWWNHKGRRMKLKDRVSLSNIVLFGLVGTLLYYFTFPFTLRVFDLLGPVPLRVIASVLLVVVLLDILYTLGTLFGLGETLKKLGAHLDTLKRMEAENPWLDVNDFGASLDNLQELCVQNPDDTETCAILASVKSLIDMGPGARRVLRAFPNMEYGGVNKVILDWLRTSWAKGEGVARRKPRDILVQIKTSFADIAHEWNPANNGMNFTVFVWIFTIGCVIGFVVETLYCIALLGKIMSRQGMLYGPFSQVYGFGAILLVLLLQPLIKKGNVALFLGGALVGGAFEYVISFMQERAFGTVSWDYSNQPFSIGGRTSLMYMLFWGILTLLFFKFVFPWFMMIIKRIPVKPRRVLAIILAVFLSANMLLSALAVNRWTERQHGTPPEGVVDVFLDANYPNSFMREVYPNMRVVSVPKLAEGDEQSGETSSSDNGASLGKDEAQGDSASDK